MRVACWMRSRTLSAFARTAGLVQQQPVARLSDFTSSSTFSRFFRRLSLRPSVLQTAYYVTQQSPMMSMPCVSAGASSSAVVCHVPGAKRAISSFGAEILTDLGEADCAKRHQTCPVLSGASDNVSGDAGPRPLVYANRGDRTSAFAFKSLTAGASQQQESIGRTPRRRWESTWRRRPSSQDLACASDWQFKVMSYNVLSPTLLAANMELYSHCDPACLTWDLRKQRLLTEILSSRCDVICLQEVDEADYVNFFEPKLSAAGYRGTYLKRRGDKTDGCATFFHVEKFTLEQESKFCYYVGQGTILDRDNVAVVLRLKPRGSGATGTTPSVCVANTHLLFNPRRGDVKLAQAAMLLAELDRLSSAALSPSSTATAATAASELAAASSDTAAAAARDSAAFQLREGYHPTIICGDFNMIPFCPIYKLLLCKELTYEGLNSVTLSGQNEGRSRQVRPLSRNLLPSAARVTNSCRYMADSGIGNGPDGLRERRVDAASGNVDPDGRPASARSSRKNPPPTDDESDAIQGVLTHQFEFVSAYRHHTYRSSNASRRDSYRSSESKVKEISSQHQHTACTLDYIFYTVDSKAIEATPNGSLYLSQVKEGALRLLGRFGLLSEEEVVLAGGLPNAAMPSDHLPLVTHFALRLSPSRLSSEPSKMSVD